MTMTDERMDELASWQIDVMDSGDIVEIVVDSLKEYWRTYPEYFEYQWEEYKAQTGEDYSEDGD